MEAQVRQEPEAHPTPSKKDEENKEKKQKSKEESPRKNDPALEWKKLNPEPPRHNKLYRTPVTPTPVETLIKETSFVLDCCSVASISEDYSRANPKLGGVLPTYNAQKDKAAARYFKFCEVPNTLRKNKQSPPGTSIDGKAMDDFMAHGAGYRYLTRRNIFSGCGLSPSQYSGHRLPSFRRELTLEAPPRGHSVFHTRKIELAQPEKDSKSGENELKTKNDNILYESLRKLPPPREFVGWNGPFGYRRNNPNLRKKPSCFETAR